MQDIAMDAARQTAPWKPSQSWWVVGLEGIVALIIGIYIVAFPADASDALRNLIAVGLLVAAAGQIVEGFRFRTQVTAPWAELRGGAGAMAAALALLAIWSVYIEPAGARQVLAGGLLVYGVIGVISLIFTVRATGFKIAATIVDLLAIALGALLFYTEAEDTSGTQLLGVAAIVGGVALLIYAYILWNRTRTSKPGPEPEAGQTPGVSAP